MDSTSSSSAARVTGPADHIALVRSGFVCELDRCIAASNELVERIQAREAEIQRLQSEQANERRELAAAELGRRTAAQAIAALDDTAS